VNEDELVLGGVSGQATVKPLAEQDKKILDNQLTEQERELDLQARYPFGTKGKIRISDNHADFLRTKGWTEETVVSIRFAYISGAGNECMTVRWGPDVNHTSMIQVKEFEFLEDGCDA